MTRIQVKLLLSPNLEDMLKDLPCRLDLGVPSGATIRDILNAAGIPLPAVYTVIQGRIRLHPDDALFKDTELILLAPIAGGCTGANPSIDMIFRIPWKASMSARCLGFFEPGMQPVPAPPSRKESSVLWLQFVVQSGRRS